MGMPAFFESLIISISWHIASQKIAQFRLKKQEKTSDIHRKKSRLDLRGRAGAW